MADGTPGARLVARLRRDRPALLAAGVLIVLHLAALAAPALAPYPEDELDRSRFLHPPQRLHWVEPGGRVHLVPFVHGTRVAGVMRYAEDRASVVPLRLFVTGAPYDVGPFRSRLHLFGGAEGARVNLLGTDAQGRDVLSRLLYGARVSLTVGLVGIAISFTAGLLLGGLAGYLGGWVDVVIMRLSELLLSIPALYLIVALRSVFPPGLPGPRVYLAIVAILALIGWASIGRVIRGMVLGLRRQEYVLAAEALGMSRLRVLVRHILPNTASFVIVAATLAIPGYILGEVFLSFLGVGIQDPDASWGVMLKDARSLSVLTHAPWLLYAPGLAILVTVMAFNVLGDGLRDALDPRGESRRRSA